MATTAGIVRSTNRPSILYLGDISALHDLNSLALFTDIKTPVVLVVINNDGGAIFDLLPVSKAHKRQLYQMPHGYQFEYAAKQFGLKYRQPNSLADYNYVVKQHLTNGEGTLMVEVITPSRTSIKAVKRVSRVFRCLLAVFIIDHRSSLPVIVCLHGFLGDSDDWAQCVECLSDYPVLCIDLRAWPK